MDGKNIIDVVLESAQDMKFDKITMHELKALSLPEIKKLTPDQIKNTSTNTL